jgi:hypothetical protein
VVAAGERDRVTAEIEDARDSADAQASLVDQVQVDMMVDQWRQGDTRLLTDGSPAERRVVAEQLAQLVIRYVSDGAARQP